MVSVGRPRLYTTDAARKLAYYYRTKKSKQIPTKVYHRSQTVEWATPQDLFDRLHAEFGFVLDVCATAENAKCARYFTMTEDGLQQVWEGVCWMNPPYGKTIAQWVTKAHVSAQTGATVVCLLPARTDTSWWHAYCLPHAEIRFIQRRLRFGSARNGAPFPSAIVIFRPPA
jgi:phage N-6-adenine-methyltransferase